MFSYEFYENWLIFPVVSNSPCCGIYFRHEITCVCHGKLIQRIVTTMQDCSFQTCRKTDLGEFKDVSSVFIRKINKCNQILNIISFDIRSLPRHSGKLLVFLEALETHFHVLVLSEIGVRNIGTVEHFLSNYDFYGVLPKDNILGSWYLCP